MALSDAAVRHLSPLTDGTPAWCGGLFPWLRTSGDLPQADDFQSSITLVTSAGQRARENLARFAGREQQHQSHFAVRDGAVALRLSPDGPGATATRFTCVPGSVGLCRRQRGMRSRTTCW